jgi:hypothetical protein
MSRNIKQPAKVSPLNRSGLRISYFAKSFNLQILFQYAPPQRKATTSYPHIIHKELFAENYP